MLPSPDDIQTVYGMLFESPSPPDTSKCSIGPIGEPPTEEGRLSILAPFTKDEVTSACKRMKTSSPCPDRVTVEDIKRVPTELLMCLFTGLLWLGDLPTYRKKKSTVLIPKSGGDLKNETNW